MSLATRSADRRTLHLLALVFAVPFLTSIPSSDLSAAETVTVAPGTVVQWPGEGITSCSMEGREWAPLPTGCWYAVDLLQGAGTIRLSRRIDGRRESADLVVGDYPYPVQHIRLKDSTHVDLSAEDAARANRESKKVGSLWSKSTGPARFELPLAAPLAKLPTGGRFGARRYFNGQPRSPHSGADYAAAAGTAVLAVADGRVLLAEEHFFAGKSVYIDHGAGLISMSFHLSKIEVDNGQEVKKGETIGRVGATGRATGPHLHFGLRWNRARIDPSVMIGLSAEPTVLASPQ